MRPKVDEDNSELTSILERLLEEDVDITGREVIRRFDGRFANQSAISRDADRKKLVEDYQEIQRERRRKASQQGSEDAESDVADSKGFSSGALSERLDKALEEIERQQKLIKALITSHAACVQAVYASSSGARLLEFFREYKQLEKTLMECGAIPPGAQLVVLPARPGAAKM